MVTTKTINLDSASNWDWYLCIKTGRYTWPVKGNWLLNKVLGKIILIKSHHQWKLLWCHVTFPYLGFCWNIPVEYHFKSLRYIIWMSKSIKFHGNRIDNCWVISIWVKVVAWPRGTSLALSTSILEHQLCTTSESGYIETHHRLCSWVGCVDIFACMSTLECVSICDPSCVVTIYGDLYHGWNLPLPPCSVTWYALGPAHFPRGFRCMGPFITCQSFCQ